MGTTGAFKEKRGRRRNSVLTEGAVGPLLVRLTIPMLFGAFGMVVFNIIDAFFAAKLGTDELAAISFTFPVGMVVASLAMGVGTGSTAVISRAIGLGERDKVVRLATDSILLALVFVGAFALLGIATIEPLFSLLGAKGRVLELIEGYMTIWYTGIVFLVVPMVGNAAIRAAGDTFTPSMMMMGAAAANIVVGPFLIFGIGPFPRLELVGAAIAQLLVRGGTLMIALYILYFREKMLSFRPVPIAEVLKSWSSILHIGLPAAGSRMAMPIGAGVLTWIFSKFGAQAVAAYGVATRVEFIGLITVFSLSVVLGPFIGQNMGAGRVDRVRHAIDSCNRFSLYWGIGVWAALVLLAAPIVKLLTADPDVVGPAVVYLSIVPLGYGLAGMVQLQTAALNVLHRPLWAASLVLLQMFGFCIPLAWAGAILFGLDGAFAGIALSLAATGITGHFVLQRALPADGEEAAAT